MQTQSKFVKWSLILGIVIVANLFVNYSLSLIYSEPQYTDFCSQTYSGTPADISAQNTCSNNFTTAQNNYEAKVFVMLVSVGVILIVASFLLKTNAVLSIAFSLSGLLSVVVASFRYWSSAENLVKVLILAAALAVLIYFAVRKFKNENVRS